MKVLKTILLLMLTNAAATSILSQEKFKTVDTLQVINFRVIDANTKEPVSMAHAINITQRQGAISDLLGYLKIPIHFGDSVKLSAIGYNNKYFFSWGQYKPDTLFYGIELTPKIYEIKEVKISRFSTYERFLKEVATLRLPVSKEDLLLERLQDYLHEIIKGADLKNLPGANAGIGFGEDWYHKQNKKLEELRDKERNRKKIEEKYNPGLVQELTGLDGDELYKFLGELNLDDTYLMTVSDYEIRENILNEYKNYCKKKETQTIKTDK